MTPEETIAAGHVMISGGPWDSKYRFDAAAVWRPCGEKPQWNWHDHEYRVRPQPQYVWINVYRSSDGPLCFRSEFATRSDADHFAANGRVGCIKILLEERFDE